MVFTTGKTVNLPEFGNYGDFDEESNIEDKFKDEEIFCLETGLVFKETKDYEWCDKCNSEFVNLMGQDQCPKCFTLKDGSKSN